MKHLKDTVVDGHEVIYYQEQYDDGSLMDEYAVDIRADNADGEIIAGYAEFATEDDARRVAMAYIDGLRKATNKEFDPKTQIAIVWSIEDIQSLADVTDTEAMDILENIKNHHDATIGVTWDTLEYTITDMGYDLKEKE